MSFRLLAIETATPACSAALSVDGEVLERYALAPRQHAALMLPMIESLLLEADLTVSQLDAIAFGRGPGSFTGVRIAASLVQGIALATDLPVVPVSTLAALALGGMRESQLPRVMAVMDARKAEVYWGCYVKTGDDVMVLQGSECVCAPDAVPDTVQVSGQDDWVGAGGGWSAYGEPLMHRLGERVVRLLPDIEPHAADVARLGVHAFHQGVKVRPEEAVPVYLRNNVAVAKRS
ncbi:MAG: tRNA (adenosine(37)-N6)-threonylcarbamoyltransferase complex dimerization subunit type 1 TsaB [Pseudomonadota bacterium]